MQGSEATRTAARYVVKGVIPPAFHNLAVRKNAAAVVNSVAVFRSVGIHEMHSSATEFFVAFQRTMGRLMDI